MQRRRQRAFHIMPCPVLSCLVPYCPVLSCKLTCMSCGVIPVSVKKYSSGEEEKTHGTISSNNTNTGGGEQFMTLCCKANAPVKGLFVTDTGITFRINYISMLLKAL